MSMDSGVIGGSYKKLMQQFANEFNSGAMRQGMPQGSHYGFPINRLGLGALGAGISGESHLGAVNEFRKRFKEYSKANFREISSRPIIKDILSGMTKLNKEEIKDRIAEHLASV